jgi:hypothetical protein
LNVVTRGRGKSGLSLHNQFSSLFQRLRCSFQRFNIIRFVSAAPSTFFVTRPSSVPKNPSLRSNFLETLAVVKTFSEWPHEVGMEHWYVHNILARKSLTNTYGSNYSRFFCPPGARVLAK